MKNLYDYQILAGFMPLCLSATEKKLVEVKGISGTDGFYCTQKWSY